MSASLTWGCKHDEGCGFYVIGYATLRFAARTGSAKDLARDTGANWRTVQGYQSGRSRPDPYFLLSLMRQARLAILEHRFESWAGDWLQRLTARATPPE